jgi:Fe2+ transport system protein FeoA
MTWMVFKAPGPDKIHGHAVQYKVISEAEREAHIAEGWFDTAIEAGEAHAKKLAEAAEKEVEEIEERAAATRDEAIQRLEEMGVVFDRRLGVTKLRQLVLDELKKREGAG